MREESCSDLCKNSPTPSINCNCRECDGDQHGSEADLSDSAIQHLLNGSINLLANKKYLGGEIETVLDFLDRRKMIHSGCPREDRQPFRIGSHAIVLGNRNKTGHIADEQGNLFWLYVICPICDYQINLHKLLREESVENQLPGYLVRQDFSHREALLRFFDAKVDGETLSAEEATRERFSNADEIEVRGHAKHH